MYQALNCAVLLVAMFGVQKTARLLICCLMAVTLVDVMLDIVDFRRKFCPAESFELAARMLAEDPIQVIQWIRTFMG